MNTQVKKLIVAMAFPVSLLLGGCAGVTPSVSLGFLHTPNPTTSTSVSDGATKVDAAGGHWEALLKHAFLTMTK